MITNETIEKGKIKKEPYTGIKPKSHISISESQSKMFDEKTSFSPKPKSIKVKLPT
ncbi:MAG: hypothetical protein J6B35_01155 [Clostridia bacterium]|nr:hypothetical protein [Clostridia bacterium]